MGGDIICIGLFVMSCHFTQAPANVVTCPPVYEWSKSDQVAAAAELKKAGLDKNSATTRLLAKSAMQIRVNRACAAVKKAGG